MNKRIALAASGIIIMSLTSCGGSNKNITKKLANSSFANMQKYKAIGLMGKNEIPAENTKKKQKATTTGLPSDQVLVGQDEGGVIHQLSFALEDGTLMGQEGMISRGLYNLDNYYIADFCLEDGHVVEDIGNGEQGYMLYKKTFENGRYWNYQTVDALFERHGTSLAYNGHVRAWGGTDYHHDAFLTTKDGFKMYSFGELFDSVKGEHKKGCFFTYANFLRTGTDKLMISFVGDCVCGGDNNSVPFGGVYEVTTTNDKLDYELRVPAKFIADNSIRCDYSACDDQGNFFFTLDAGTVIGMTSNGEDIDVDVDLNGHVPFYVNNGKVAIVSLSGEPAKIETLMLGDCYLYDSQDGLVSYPVNQFVGSYHPVNDYDISVPSGFTSLRVKDIKKYGYYYNENDGKRYYISDDCGASIIYEQQEQDDYFYLNTAVSAVPNMDGVSGWIAIKGNAYRFDKNANCIYRFNSETLNDDVFYDFDEGSNKLIVSSIEEKDGYIYVKGTSGFDSKEWYLTDEGVLAEEVVTRTPEVNGCIYPIN